MRPKSARSNIFALSLVVIGSAFMAGFVGGEVEDWLDSSSSNPSQISERVVSSDAEQIKKVAEEVGRSVVSINVVAQQTSFFGQDFDSSGAGTGIIISEDGYLITNRHVIPEGASEIEIVLSDGTKYSDITVVGRDPRSGVDIAFLKINGVSGLQAAIIGDSDTMKVGDTVLAIGNALGEFQNSVTTGIISGRSRPIIAGDFNSAEALTNLLQTDAAINPGNSGGPLVNLSGEVIGINTAVADGENLGFAISISDVSGSITSVLETGVFEVPYLGVRYETIDSDYADEFDLSVTEGVIVRSRGTLPAVVPGSPADEAGLEDRDIIVAVDGQRLNAESGLSKLVGRKKVGETVMLDILRGDEELTLEATLQAAPESF